LKNIKFALALSLGAAIFSAAVEVEANEELRLYKDYKFGQPMEQLLKVKGVYDCSKDVGEGALCTDEGHTFAGVNVRVIFTPMKGKLVSVTLASSFDNDTYLAMFGALKKQFDLVKMVTESEGLDILQASKKMNRDAFAGAVNEFEQRGLGNGNLTYIWLDKTSTSKPLKQKPDSVAKLFRLCPPSLREVDFQVLEDGDEAFIIAAFTLPKQVKKILREQMDNAPSDPF